MEEDHHLEHPAEEHLAEELLAELPHPEEDQWGQEGPSVGFPHPEEEPLAVLHHPEEGRCFLPYHFQRGLEDLLMLRHPCRSRPDRS